MKMKKKSILMASACLPLMMSVNKADADNRLQYSAEDANTLATDDNNNTMSYTYSHGGRKGATLTAKDPYSAAERHSGVSGANSSGPHHVAGRPGRTDTQYDERGFDSNGINKDTGTQYDEAGFNVNGYNADGYDTDGYDVNGDWACSEWDWCDNTRYESDGSGNFYCAYDSCCYPAGTPITLADGSTKPVEDITYDDDLLVWDFDEGKFASAKPLWIKIPEVSPMYEYARFSDGSVLKTINQHRIFNAEAGKFTYAVTDDTPLGTHTLNAKGELVELVEKKIVKEEVTYYNIETFRHINCFAGGVLTSNRLNNLYPIKDLKFVKDNRKIVPYEEFADKIERKWYDGYRLGEQPKEINREGDIDMGDRSLIDYVLRSIDIMA